jgi:5-methylcytosine-specific restriction endonuclease McrA
MGIPWNKGIKTGQVPWHAGTTGLMTAWNKGVSVQLNTGRTHFLKGHIPWQKGKPMSKDSIQKMHISLTGRKQSESTKHKRSLSLRGKRLGEKSNFWRGGINPLRMIIRDLSEACEWRRNVFTRDEYTCKFCGLHGVYLEAHHLKRFTDIFREFLERHSMLSPVDDKYRLVELARSHGPFWDVNNGISLCKKCHEKTKGV